MLNLRAILLILVLFVFVVLSFTPLAAQTATATLGGTVEDQNSAVIPDASVTIKNKDTSFERTATTNESGSFTIPLLPPGTYSILVRRDGFTAVEIRQVILNVGDQKSIVIALKVGDVNSTVEVRPDETLLNTSPAVATTIDRTFVQNLPLNGRSFQSLILLTPGVVPTAYGTTTPGDFSVNGQRQNTNYFTVDGVSANTGVSTYPSAGFPDATIQQTAGTLPGYTALGTTGSLVSVDALEEFTIQTSTTSAEYGRQPGGQVQLVTRSGKNDFHGSLFHFLRNEALDANNWFSNARNLPQTPLRQNQFGGTFSGPVMLPGFGEGGKPLWNGRDKTFFFFSYEGTRLRIPVLDTSPQVPSLRLRQIAHPSVQPFLNAFPLPTGPETIGANGQPSGYAPFALNYSNPSSADTYGIRIDHNVSSNLALFGRYTQTPSNSLTRTLNRLSGAVIDSRSLTLGTIYTHSSQLSNDFRFNYTQNRGRTSNTMDDFGGAIPVDLSLLTSGYSGSGPASGTLLLLLPGFSGLTPQYSLGDAVDNYQRQFNIVNSTSVVLGTHQLKFGFDWRHLTPVIGPRAYGQSIYFFSSDNLINGISPLIVTLASQGSRPVFDNFSLYAQDTWKLSKRLTLDLGLRWELNPPPRDANGIEPVLVTGITGQDTSRAALAPSGTPFYKTFYTAFAPRAGVAYQLNQKSGRETVLRGGFGVYYDLGSNQATSGFFGYPFNSSRTQFDVPFPLPTGTQPPFPPVQLPIASDLYSTNSNLKLPYTLQWNVSLDQSLGKDQAITASYVTSAGRRLLVRWTLNQQAFNPVTGTFLPRPNPNFANILHTDNGPTSDYHSLQMQYRRRLSRGLQALVNYTWSHAMDEVSTELFGNQLERGNANFDIRHNFSAAFSYEIPKLKNSSPLILRSLANGWLLDGIIFVNSGTPLDILGAQVITSNGSFLYTRPDLVSDQPIWIKDGSVPGGQRLNRAAFVLPPRNSGGLATRPGTLGRNVIYAPGIYQLNMALSRRFAITEKLNLQLKAEVFNVPNHPLFTNYDTNFFSFFLSPTVGQPTAMLGTGLSPAGGGGLNSLYQLGGPRSIQLSFRLSF